MKLKLLLICLLGINLSVNSQKPDLLKAEFQVSINKPAQVTKIAEGHFLIDFGKAFFGTVTIQSQSTQKEAVVVHLGEKLSDGHQLDRNPPGTVRYQMVQIPKLEANKAETVQLKVDSRNTKSQAILLPDSFGVVIPFRYCEIENLKVPIGEVEILQKAFHYKFYDESSSFTSSDTLLNAIWALCKHTIKATSFAGYYVDGDRERIPYEADAYINQLGHYSVDTVYSLARRTNEYFIDHPTWPTEWILHTALMFYTDYLYTGDIQSIKKYYDRLKAKALMELAREDGMISTKSPNLNDELMGKLGFQNAKTRIRDIVDWPVLERDGYDMVEVNTVVNAFYCHNLMIMSKIAGALGEKEDSVFYLTKSNQVKNQINAKLFDKTRGLYVDGEGSQHASIHANLFPLAFDLVPSENRASVIQFIRSKGMACSVYGAQFLLEGLMKNGQSDYVLDLITDTKTDRSWWNMMQSGATMTMEAWDMKYKPNSDWNHAWGTAPLNIITRYIWGIQPSNPGFSTAQISPQMGNLSSSEIKVPTIKGSIYATFKLKRANYGIYEIDIPENMDAQFVIPVDNARVSLNNKSVTTQQTILHLESGHNIIKIRN